VLFNELLVLFQVQYRLFSFAGAIAIALYICMCDHRRRPKHTHTNLSRCNEVASIPVLPSENACGKQIFCCSPHPLPHLGVLRLHSLGVLLPALNIHLLRHRLSSFAVIVLVIANSALNHNQNARKVAFQVIFLFFL